jgi:hypothetical protein
MIRVYFALGWVLEGRGNEQVFRNRPLVSCHRDASAGDSRNNPSTEERADQFSLASP